MDSDKAKDMQPPMGLDNSPVNSDSISDVNGAIDSKDKNGADDLKRSAQSDSDHDDDSKSDPEEIREDIKEKPKPKNQGMQL